MLTPGRGGRVHLEDEEDKWKCNLEDKKDDESNLEDDEDMH